MKLRPTIFLSGVSSEFASFRDAVEIEIQKKGCFADNQSSFPPDYRTVEAMLHQRLSDADAVIHIVGFRFGAEPNERPADKPRRSYTQMEFEIAREVEKPVYVFLSSDPKVRDAASADEKEEDTEATSLQLAHRQAVQRTNYLYYFFKDKDELCKLAAQIPQVVTFDFRADISRIVEYAPEELIGREDELALLNDSWLKVRRAESPRPHILTFVALGGEGKTSVVAKWAAELAYHNWPGCDSAFAWSFYSQGTREQYAASSDLFLKEAITFFGNESDKEFAASNAGAYEKGQRLARILSQRRSLLILDGLEPLQYAPTSPTPGELKDAGLAALLKSLAADNEGLCIVTTRYSVSNLRAFWQTTAREVKLLRLSTRAGVHLLKTLGVNGTDKEFETLVEDVKGHALTLNLLGTYLRDAHGGDIRRRDLVKLEEADTEEQGGHAFRVMEAYAQAFQNEGEKGQRALAILRLLGLFDRPVSADCLTALLKKPAITRLTGPLVQCSEVQRNVVLKRLEVARLLTINREASGALVLLDAHPLLREYFGEQLRTQQPEAWRAAHRRLYEHLCATTPEEDEPTLEDLQPLYQAIAHGCHASLHQQVCQNLYLKRILQERRHYTWHKLGAYGSEIGALACFFDTLWIQPSSRVSQQAQAWLLHEAAFCLHALGRLTEALEPMRAALKMHIKRENWREAPRTAANLVVLELTLGKLNEAISAAEQAATYVDYSGEPYHQMVNRTVRADALHQAGRRALAQTLFLEAEQVQKKRQPHYPLLYSAQGFKYCDFILAEIEGAAWRCALNRQTQLPVCVADSEKDATIFRLLKGRKKGYKSHSKLLRDISQRTAQTLKWTESIDTSLLASGLDYLTLGRVALYKSVLSASESLATSEDLNVKTIVDRAVNDLRRAAHSEFLVHGLLTRAWLRFSSGACSGPDSAQADLDEAWEIAERGPMRLHMADIHLYRARLFFREEKYPWGSAREDLAAARKLIEQCGYWRRKEELEDAERVILGQSV